MSKDTPRIVDNDRDEITVMLDGREIRGWFYANEQERRIKMLCACEFVESWYQAETSSLNRNGGSAWQPIETAPFNEDVLVFSPDSTDPVMICHRCLFGDETEADWDGDWHEQNVDMCPHPLDVDVTHWMPLPEPPKGGDA